MSRERFRDDNREDYDEQPRQKSGGNKGLIIGLAVGGGLLFVCLAASLVPVVAVDKGEPAKQVEMAKLPPRKIYSRDEFSKVVMGRSAVEVVAKFNKPDRTAEGEGGLKFWYYNAVTRDPVSGQVDPHVKVVIEGTQVERVEYGT